jgi:hypothetical protein
MHGAGTALSDAAAKLRAGHSEHVAQDPKQWHVVGNVDLMGLSVDEQV